MSNMKIQLVQMIDRELIVSWTDEQSVHAFMEVRGFSFVKLNANQRHRAELQGQPVFAGVLGPMWGGLQDGKPTIRYEDADTYRAMSV